MASDGVGGHLFCIIFGKYFNDTKCSERENSRESITESVETKISKFPSISLDELSSTIAITPTNSLSIQKTTIIHRQWYRFNFKRRLISFSFFSSILDKINAPTIDFIFRWNCPLLCLNKFHNFELVTTFQHDVFREMFYSGRTKFRWISYQTNWFVRKHRVRRTLTQTEKLDMQRRVEIELENMAHLSRPYLTEVSSTKKKTNCMLLFCRKKIIFTNVIRYVKNKKKRRWLWNDDKKKSLNMSIWNEIY